MSLERELDRTIAGNLEKGCGDSNHVSIPKYPAVEIRIVDYNNLFQGKNSHKNF
jgi:hypothetical protein